ncbi:MAG: DUF2298 domain-containing protein [Anaerolineae bacterium]
MTVAYFILWYLTVQVIGLAALPITLRLFRNLPDRGYAFARPLGLLLMGYVLWLSVSFGFLRNQWVTIVALLIAMAGVSIWLWRREPLGDFLRARRRTILVVEALFLIGMIVAAFVRSYSPEIATAGGEKFMEYAFINSILRSDTFPPPDPWLSGYIISYYYLGYVILAMLIKLSGIPAAIGFNLSLALLFALTLTGAFGVVYNLTTRKPAEGEPVTGSVGYGLLGALFVAVLGNLEGFLEVLHGGGVGSPAFWAWLDIKDVNGPATGAGWMPDRFIWWWRASRVITDRVGGGVNEVIDEFPFFSFLLGDNHPHVLALPFVLLAVAFAVNVLRSPKLAELLSPRDWRFWARLLPAALVLGALGFLNSWDFPTYSLIFVGAFAIQLWLTQASRGWRWARDVVLVGLGVGVMGILLYLPFWIGLQSQARGIAPQTLVKTHLAQYLVMFGPFVLIAVVFLGAQVGRLWVRRRELDFTPVLFVAVVTVPPLAVLLWRGWWTAAFLSVLVATAITTLLLTIRSAGSVDTDAETQAEGTPAARPRRAGASVARLQNPTLHTLFVLLLFAVAFSLTLLTEFAFIRDNFNSRMNSVFKFYFQAWILLALASAYAAWWLLGRVRGTGGLRIAQYVFAGALAVVVAMGLVYPALATYTRSNEFRGPSTLDGTAWVAQQRPDDYAAIQWLNANIQGQPTILEAPGDQGKSYAYEGRMSAFTGLPTVLGWGGHESQWRGNYDEPGRRESLLTQVYQTTDQRVAQQILDQFDVDYVVVGSAERERFGGRGPQLTKFDRFMDQVFKSGDTIIYRRR